VPLTLQSIPFFWLCAHRPMLQTLHAIPSFYSAQGSVLLLI
jgi:hypothetical protein